MPLAWPSKPPYKIETMAVQENRELPSWRRGTEKDERAPKAAPFAPPTNKQAMVVAGSKRGPLLS